MLIMVVKLSYRVCWRAKYEQITHGDRFWMVLKQLLPLAAFPIIFFIFIIPMLVFNILVGNNPSAPNEAALRLAIIVCTPMWSMLSGVVMLIHVSVVHRCQPRCPFKGKWCISVVRCSSSKKGKDVASDILLENTLEPEISPISHPGRPSRNSVTHCTLPPASV